MERISLAQVNNGERFFRVPKLLLSLNSIKRCLLNLNCFMPS